MKEQEASILMVARSQRYEFLNAFTSIIVRSGVETYF